MKEKLLSEIKNYLNIGWEDPATDQNVMAMIEEGMDFLNRKAGQTLNFEAEKDAMSLLKNYARYARDMALDVFEVNFRSAILALQHDRMIERRRYAEDTVSAGQSDQPGL